MSSALSDCSRMAPPAAHRAPLMRDWHGVERCYVRRTDGRTAPTLISLSLTPLMFDREGINAAWGLCDAPHRTVLANVLQAPTSRVVATSPLSWDAAVETDVATIARAASAPALALGGGIDAALVLAAWRASGLPMPTVFTLATGLPTYDEVEAALAAAASLGVRCEVIHVTPRRLVELLPRCITACETPLYNLHPVSRLALAIEVRARGHDVLVTGDGADAAFLGCADLDYVPVVAALTTVTGLGLRSPFFLRNTLVATLARAPDQSKHVGRAYGVAAGLPSASMTQPKRPRWMPPLELERYLDVVAIRRLGEALGISPSLESDRARVGWVTLHLLARHLEGA